MSENVIDFQAAQAARRRNLINGQLEQSLLGMLLQESRLCDHLPLGFRADAFVDVRDQDLYRAIIAAHDVAPAGPLLLLVIEKLQAVTAEREYITSLVNAVVGMRPDYVKLYADRLTGLAAKRATVALIESVRDQIFDDSADLTADEIIRSLIVRAEQVARTSEANPIASMNQAMDAALAASIAAAQRNGLTGLTTGMPSFDREFDGLQPGNLIVLAGRPGMGKSALAMQWVVAAGRRCRAVPSLGGVFVASLEMQAKELGQRALAECGDVPVTNIRTGRVGEDDYKLTLARQELDGLPVLIEDTGGLDIAAIKLRARQAVRAFGKLALIMLDHLHIVEPDSADLRKGETYATGRISNACKIMAKEFGCPVLMLAQLNRKVEDREDKRPQLADLRQTGSIEQDADLVIFLYREEYYIENVPPARRNAERDDAYKARVQSWNEQRANAYGKAEAIVAKNRGGQKTTINLTWHGQTTSFGDVP